MENEIENRNSSYNSSHTFDAYLNEIKNTQDEIEADKALLAVDANLDNITKAENEKNENVVSNESAKAKKVYKRKPPKTIYEKRDIARAKMEELEAELEKAKAKYDRYNAEIEAAKREAVEKLMMEKSLTWDDVYKNLVSPHNS